MINKLKVVLSKPRLIGLYINENIIKSLLMLFIATLIVLIPPFIKISLNDSISSSFSTQLVEGAITSKINNCYISDNELFTNQTYQFETSEFSVIIGQTDELSLYQTLQFDTNSIKYFLSNIEVYEITYEELNVKDIDFEEISYKNIIVANEFINIFNKLYQENKTVITLYNMSYIMLDLIIAVISSALFLTLISYIISSAAKNLMPFKCRFKICLNCQYIYLLFILFSFLYNAYFFQYIGNLLMFIYVVLSIKSVTIRKKRVE